MSNRETDGCVDIVLVRLNIGFVPFGLFLYSSIPEDGTLGREAGTGYDAAVPIDLYEPWVIEVFYDSDLGLVATVRIVAQVWRTKH